MTYRKRKFFVQLIVNFNEIQHYTWLGTFWNFVYKYTFIYTASSLHSSFLFMVILDYQPGPFHCTVVIIVQLLHIYKQDCFFYHRNLLFHLDCFRLPEHRNPTRFSYRICNWFLPNFFFLPDFLPDMYLISTRFSCIYQIS